ncbi:Lipoprotein [Cupriavidus taiwanensis]
MPDIAPNTATAAKHAMDRQNSHWAIHALAHIMVVGPDDRAMVLAARGTAMRHCRSQPGAFMLISRQCMAVALLALGCTAASAQQGSAPDAAGAIAEAVQGGASPYRPPAAASEDPDDARRAKCESLKAQYNATSKQRAYQSSGPATQTAQGRTIPKIERDKSRKSLQEAYRANCT